VTATSTFPAGCSTARAFTAGDTKNFETTGAVCYRTNATIAGWYCSNFQGRSLKVNDVALSCGDTLPARWSDGYYYFAASGSADAVTWATIYYW
jgi:hypothetical protein